MIKKPKTSGEGQNLKEETPVRQIDTPLRWLGQWMHGLQGQSLGPAPAPPMSRGRQNFQRGIRCVHLAIVRAKYLKYLT